MVIMDGNKFLILSIISVLCFGSFTLTFMFIVVLYIFVILPSLYVNWMRLYDFPVFAT